MSRSAPTRLSSECQNACQPWQNPRVGFAVGPKVIRLLDALLATGLYGRTRAVVARELMLRSLREAVAPRRPR